MMVLCIDTGETTNWRFPFPTADEAVAALNLIAKALHEQAATVVIRIDEGMAVFPRDKIKGAVIFDPRIESESHANEKALAIAKALSDQDIEDAVKAAKGSHMGFK